MNMPVLFQLLAGGIPGVALGCLLARRIPATRLKTIVAMIAIFAGLQLMWAGSRKLAEKYTATSPAVTVHADTSKGRVRRGQKYRDVGFPGIQLRAGPLVRRERLGSIQLADLQECLPFRLLAC